MNDPNGLIQWKGQYHLFYQHNPNGPFWGTMHWRHALSRDLVHWTHLPIALAPTSGGPDQDGCFSGCAVDNDGVPTLIYTGIVHTGVQPRRRRRERQCIATSTDNLLTWKKYAGNPVIASPPEGLDVVGFRDPCVWHEGDTWYMLIGSGIQDVGGTVLLYKSTDLIHWEYINPILIGDKDQTDPVPTGTMWECPDFFPLGDKHVLIVSVQDVGWRKSLHTAYFIGTYTDYQFTPEILRKLDFGDMLFYAPQALLDEPITKSRRVMFGWVREGRSDESQRAAGWTGVMSLPRILTIRPDGLLGMDPAPELETLRRKHYRWEDVDFTLVSSNMLKDVQGDCLEILADFEPGDATVFGFKARCSPDGIEQTRIAYDCVAKRLAVDRERSSLSPDVHRGVQGGALDLAAGEGLRLHVFLDRSVVEVYANGRACLTSRVYPSQADSLGVDLFAHGGSVRLKSLDIWEMGSIGTRGAY